MEDLTRLRWLPTVGQSMAKPDLTREGEGWQAKNIGHQLMTKTSWPINRAFDNLTKNEAALGGRVLRTNRQGINKPATSGYGGGIESRPTLGNFKPVALPLPRRPFCTFTLGTSVVPPNRVSHRCHPRSLLWLMTHPEPVASRG